MTKNSELPGSALRACVFQFQKCVLFQFQDLLIPFFTVSDLPKSNSFFYRFRYLKFNLIFSTRIFVANDFCFQHSFSFSILIIKFYSVKLRSHERFLSDVSFYVGNRIGRAFKRATFDLDMLISF